LQLVAKYLVLSSDPKQENNSLVLCNNAAWATNMLLLTYPTEIAQHLDTLAKQFVELLLTKKLNDTFAYNLAANIGLIALYQPKAISPYLSQITKNWAIAMDNPYTNKEKLTTFKGFFLAINENPDGVATDFPYLCTTLLRYQGIDQELELAWKNLFIYFKKIMAENWDSYLMIFPQKVLSDINMRFGS